MDKKAEEIINEMRKLLHDAPPDFDMKEIQQNLNLGILDKMERGKALAYKYMDQKTVAETARKEADMRKPENSVKNEAVKLPFFHGKKEKQPYI